MDYVPVIFASAKSGLRVDEVMAMALRVQEERLTRIPTSEINRILREAVDEAVTADARGQTPEDLLRHAGAHRSADVLVLRQQYEVDARDV